MSNLLALTLASRLNGSYTSNSGVSYQWNIIPENSYRDREIMQRIEKVYQKNCTLFKREETQRPNNDLLAVSIRFVYDEIMGGRFSNSNNDEYVHRFKSPEAFVGYYKNKLGCNHIDTKF